VFLLAIVFYFAPIPEVTDADMALQAEQSASLTGFEDKPLWQNKKLIFAVAAQFCYVGAQVAVASQFISYGKEVVGLSSKDASNRYAVGQGVFAIGRFTSAGLLLYVKPRYIMLVSAIGVMVFTILAIVLHGEAGLAMLTVVLFFESSKSTLCVFGSLQLLTHSTDQFPLILTTGIRGLGRHTKTGSSLIVAAISGGAFFPAMTGLAADRWGWNICMFVPLIGFIVSTAYGVYINTVSAKELDGFRESKIGYVEGGMVVGDVKNGGMGLDEDGARKGSVTYVEMGPVKGGRAGSSGREL